MASNFETLKHLVQEKGTEKMKQIVIVVEGYIEELNRMFRSCEIRLAMLSEFDFSSLLRKLGFESHSINRSDVYTVARHVWDFTDDHGVEKNGNNLHQIWPSMFADEKTFTPVVVFKNILPYM